MLAQSDLNVFEGSCDFSSGINCVNVEVSLQHLKICVSLGDTGKRIVAFNFMLTGSTFQVVIK